MRRIWTWYAFASEHELHVKMSSGRTEGLRTAKRTASDQWSLVLPRSSCILMLYGDAKFDVYVHAIKLPGALGLCASFIPRGFLHPTGAYKAGALPLQADLPRAV